MKLVFTGIILAATVICLSYPRPRSCYVLGGGLSSGTQFQFFNSRIGSTLSGVLSPADGSRVIYAVNGFEVSCDPATCFTFTGAARAGDSLITRSGSARVTEFSPERLTAIEGEGGPVELITGAKGEFRIELDRRTGATEISGGGGRWKVR